MSWHQTIADYITPPNTHKNTSEKKKQMVQLLYTQQQVTKRWKLVATESDPFTNGKMKVQTNSIKCQHRYLLKCRHAHDWRSPGTPTKILFCFGLHLLLWTETKPASNGTPERIIFYFTPP
ncbi:hypothetical protein AMECASPLE_017811 [Ameca splendens]|uniref:Uncharacterized protein n=1 Tax=Ameca splendens TaxID=208324 RepID=A0ABV0ZNH2_9TELE